MEFECSFKLVQLVQFNCVYLVFFGKPPKKSYFFSGRALLSNSLFKKTPISCRPVRKVLSPPLPPPHVWQKKFFLQTFKIYGFFYHFSICISKDPE